MSAAMRRGRHFVALATLAGALIGGCTSMPAQPPGAALAHLPRHVELTHVPFFPQDEYQCGPAALATVLRSAAVPVSPDELTAQVYLPGRRGSLQVELTSAARARARLAYQLPGQLPALYEQLAAGTPVLVMQNLGLRSLPAWHFAVMVGYDLDAGTVVLRSGQTQRLSLPVRRFVQTWQRAAHWALVILEPDQLPANPDLDRYIAAAASLEAVGQLDAAERAYQRARRQWPQSVWPPLGLANVRLARGDTGAAENGYFAALQLDPDNAVAHNNIAEILADRGCLVAARRHVERAVALAKETSLQRAVSATAERIIAAGASQSAASCPPP